MPPTTLASLPKEQLLSDLQALYAKAEPINNQMVDVSMEIQATIAEIYRRSILKQTGLTPEPAKCIMALACNVNPNKGIPELARRLGELANVGIKLVRVEFSEPLNEFRFYADPATIPSDSPSK